MYTQMCMHLVILNGRHVLDETKPNWPVVFVNMSVLLLAVLLTPALVLLWFTIKCVSGKNFTDLVFTLQKYAHKSSVASRAFYNTIELIACFFDSNGPIGYTRDILIKHQKRCRSLEATFRSTYLRGEFFFYQRVSARAKTIVISRGFWLLLKVKILS